MQFWSQLISLHPVVLQEEEEDGVGDKVASAGPAGAKNKVTQIQGAVQAELRAHQLPEEQMADDVEASVPCSTPEVTDLKQRLLPVLREINAKILTQKRGRGDRFFVQGLYNGPGLLDDEDGNVCDNENIAVIFEPHVSTQSEASTDLDDPVAEATDVQASTNLELFYGNIQEMTAKRCGKQRTVHRVHLQERTARVRCKWYQPLLKRGKHAMYHGKYAFVLSVVEREGFNERVNCDAMLSAVRMIPDEQHGCFLLVDADRVWAEEELARTVEHNARLAAAPNEAARKQIGPYKKNVRPDHDALKSQLLFHE